MKKILVTGGAGYIGSHVVKELTLAGFQPIVYDNLSLGLRSNIPEDVEFIEADIIDFQKIKKALNGCDAVIHLAALKAANDSMVVPEQYAQNNISGSISVLNAMVETGVNNIVFSSTAAVYGDSKTIPVKESCETIPTNFYGFTKLEIERLCDWYSRLGKINFSALRYFNVAGYDVDGQVRGLEQSPNNLFPILMEKLKGIRSEVTIFGNDYDTPDGTCIRDYIHVTDLAKAHIMALNYLFDKSENLIVNLGTTTGWSVKQVVDRLEQLSGKSLNVKVGEKRSGDMAKLICDYSRAKEKLGWQPNHSDLDTLLLTMLDVYDLK